MRLDQLTTPLERRRIIHYATDGNKVVRHWRGIRHIVSSLYLLDAQPPSSNPAIVICFPGIQDGLQLSTVDATSCTVEYLADTATQKGWDSPENFVRALDACMAGSQHIRAVEVEFVAQFNREAAIRYAKYRKEREARAGEDEAREREKRAAEEAAELAREKEQARAELEAKRAKYLGWADKMTPVQLGRAVAVLEDIIVHEGKRLTKRQFVIQMVNDGWKPRKEEDIRSWVKRNGEYREGRPRTEYQIHKDNIYYKVTKIEYEFAKFLAEQETSSGQN